MSQRSPFTSTSADLQKTKIYLSAKETLFSMEISTMRLWAYLLLEDYSVK
jgi:hypothetical protein